MHKVLIVDDEEYIRMLYKKVFESEGYQVLLASDSNETMQVMGNEEPDLIILDIELEEESGLELLNHIRRQFRDCAVILNSAYATYKSDFQSWLADAYIMKSSDVSPLKEKVRELLGESTIGTNQ